MFYRQVILLFLTICIYTHFNVAKEYGLAKLRISKYEQCKGPKRIDCCTATSSVDGLVITQNLNVMENIHLTHGKVVGYSNAKQVMKFPTEKPCYNILVNSMFKKYINITDDCTVLKGSFDLKVMQFDQCKGPKRKDCAISTGKINDQISLDLDVDIKENTKTTKGKIVVMSKGKETLRLQVKDPCQHLFLKPLFQSLLNVTSDCVIIKGHYHFNVNIQEVARKYYGGDFLFGNWTFKSLFYNEGCNFSCSIIEVSIVPRSKDS